MSANNWRWKLVSSLLLLLLIPACTLLSPPKVSYENVNLMLGNPSAATSNPANANNYLILRPQYALSYNRDKEIPNWVSWQLNQSWIGTSPRSPFAPDSTLPQDWYRVKPNDYTGTGFDRGHMIPAADRNRTQVDSEAVFLMTNILPQSPDNNRGPWEKLERYCRGLVEQGKELYIISGAAGTGGIGEVGYKTRIAGGKIAVPASTWKIIVVLERPGLGLGGVTNNTRVIAVVIPNRQGIKNDNWRAFKKSVRQIESLTGYNFLPNVPKSTQNVLESKVDQA